MRYLCRRDSVPVSGRQREGYREKRRLWCVVRGLYWWRSMSRSVWPMLLLAVLLVSAVFPLSGCGTNEDVSDKLDSRLMGLIDAEKRGEIESFARMAGFDLVDGSVKIVVICKPGQCEKAMEIVSRVGTITSEADRYRKIGAFVPITSLTALAREESISKIRDIEKPETN